MIKLKKKQVLKKKKMTLDEFSKHRLSSQIRNFINLRPRVNQEAQFNIK
jgi:hypothetical protein